MAGQIKLTPEELRTSARRYSEGSHTIEDILNQLKSEQQVIDANWEGAAWDRFDQQFQDLVPQVQQFSQLLEDIYQQLLSVADTIEQTDQDIASKIG